MRNFSTLLLIIFHYFCFANGDIKVKLAPEKNVFLDYIPELLSEDYKPIIIFTQQKYNKEGFLEQVDSFSLTRIEETFESQKNEKGKVNESEGFKFKKKNFQKFNSDLEGSNLEVSFKKNVIQKLSNRYTTHYFQKQPEEYVESGAYDVIYNDIIHIYKNTLRITTAPNISMEMNFENVGVLIKKVNITFDINELYSTGLEGAKNAPLTVQQTIAALFNENIYVQDDIEDAVALTVHTLDVLYNNYDWGVLVLRSPDNLPDVENFMYVIVEYLGDFCMFYGKPK